MANSVLLASYTMRLIDKKSNGYVNLDGKDGGINLIDFLEKFLSGLKDSYFHEEGSKQIFKVLELNKEDNYIHGVVSSGRYGMSANIVDTDTMKSAYSRRAKDAIALPFYFMVYTTPNSKRAILILQRIGIQGVQSVMLSAFRAFLKSVDAPFVLDARSQVPKQVVEHLLDSKVKSVTLISHKMTEDFASRVGVSGDNLQSVIFTQVLKVKGKNDVLRVPGFYDALRRTRKVLEGDIDLEEDDDNSQIKVSVSYNGRPRTVSLSKPGKIAPYIDVTNEITINSNGHPNLEELHSSALQLASDLSVEVRQ